MQPAVAAITLGTGRSNVLRGAVHLLILAALLFLAMKFVIRNPALYQEPKGNEPPPWWIRATLIGTCTAVSFAHGSNDGQKGMGLIMLILIGTVPTAYALNKAMPDKEIAAFTANSASVVSIE